MKTISSSILLLVATAAFVGCAATHTTSFLHPEYDFSQVERVAVVPFENLSTDQGSGNYVTRVFLTELLATGAFDVVEPGEVTRVVGAQPSGHGAELSLDQIKKVASDLNVQAVVFGTVGESAELHSGGMNSHAISLDLRMVETQNGTTIWSADVNTGAPGFFARILGTGEQTRGSAVRKAVRKAISTLIH